MRRSVNLANLGLLEFRLVRELGAGQPEHKNTIKIILECDLRVVYFVDLTINSND